jgi:hypothetical protein
MDGQVVGINTFGEASISGAVRIGTLRALLKTDSIWESVQVEPSPELLPSLSTFRYPVEILNSKIQTEPLNGNAYRFGAGDFTVTAITPVLVGKMQSATGRMREINRYARRSKFISDPEFMGEEDPYYEWHRTTETALDYAVTFDIRPASGPTKRNMFATLANSPLALVGKGRKRDMEFKGEFLELRVYRDGQLIEPVMPGRQIIEGTTTDVKRNPFIDEAYAGSYVYSPDEFMRGNEFKFQVIDARKPEEIHKEVVFGADSPLIRQLRMDFSYSPDFIFLKAP